MYPDRSRRTVTGGRRALDGLDALSVLRPRQPDLILLDLIMPRMGGLEVLETVKQDPRTQNIPVVILTNLGEEADIERGSAAGCGRLPHQERRPTSGRRREGQHPSSQAAGTGRRIGHARTAFYVRDHEGDADRLPSRPGSRGASGAPRVRSSCSLELVPDPERAGLVRRPLRCARPADASSERRRSAALAPAPLHSPRARLLYSHGS